MKTTKTIKSLYFVWIMLLIAFVGKAQGQLNNESDLNNFIQAAPGDASKLISAYVNPVIKGVSYGMTSGWYHTAKTHKTFGVDLGVTVSAVNLPSSEETFNPNDLGLSANTVVNSQIAPTIIGPKIPSDYTLKYNAAAPGVPISGPEGLDFKKNLGGNWIPVPMYQVGVGIIKSTDLKVRFMPDTKSGDSHVKMLGFGLMHDVKQHFQGIKLLPFDLSVLVAYNSLSGSTTLINLDQSNDGKPYSTNGSVAYKLNSWIVQAIISKKVAILTFYLGAGYAAVSSKVDVKGTFVLDPYAASLSVPNPVSINYSNNGAKLTAGIRFKFGPIYLNTDYSVQKYNALTVGIGGSIL